MTKLVGGFGAYQSTLSTSLAKMNPNTSKFTHSDSVNLSHFHPKPPQTQRHHPISDSTYRTKLKLCGSNDNIHLKHSQFGNNQKSSHTTAFSIEPSAGGTSRVHEKTKDVMGEYLERPMGKYATNKYTFDQKGKWVVEFIVRFC